MKKHSAHSLSVLALGAAVCLSSCLNDSDLTMLEGTGGGAVAAGTAGYGIAKLVGASNKNATYVAVTSAVLGGFLGNRWAASVVKEKEAYASSEAYLKANIKQLDTRISNVRSTNDQLQSKISSLKAKKGKISSQEMSKVRQAHAQQKQLIQTDIDNAKKALSSGNAQQKEALRQRISTLQQQRTVLGNQVATLSRYEAKI